jgi:hypothetical protein
MKGSVLTFDTRRHAAESSPWNEQSRELRPQSRRHFTAQLNDNEFLHSFEANLARRSVPAIGS